MTGSSGLKSGPVRGGRDGCDARADDVVPILSQGAPASAAHGRRISTEWNVLSAEQNLVAPPLPPLATSSLGTRDAFPGPPLMPRRDRACDEQRRQEREDVRLEERHE